MNFTLKKCYQIFGAICLCLRQFPRQLCRSASSLSRRETVYEGRGNLFSVPGLPGELVLGVTV